LDGVVKFVAMIKTYTNTTMMVLGMMEGSYMCMKGHYDKYARTCHTRNVQCACTWRYTFHEITCPPFTLSDFQEGFRHVTGGYLACYVALGTPNG
jgi:hypothetical protein